MRKKFSIFLAIFWLISILVSAIILRSKIVYYELMVFNFEFFFSNLKKYANLFIFQLNRYDTIQLVLFSIKFFCLICSLVSSLITESFNRLPKDNKVIYSFLKNIFVLNVIFVHLNCRRVFHKKEHLCFHFTLLIGLASK
jgi:hypothetical protein